MPVHHRLRFLTFPMRASRLCSLWSDMRPLRFRRVPFGRDVAFDPGGATASRITMPHILPSTVPSVSASATLLISWLNPPPHPITVYASHPPLPTTTQHSLPGGVLPPYRGRSFTGRIASASPDAPEPEVRIHLPPAVSQQTFCSSQDDALSIPAAVPGRTERPNLVTWWRPRRTYRRWWLHGHRTRRRDHLSGAFPRRLHLARSRQAVRTARRISRSCRAGRVTGR